MSDDWIWLLFIILILFVPWDRVWDRLLGKEQEETMDPELRVEDNELFSGKCQCLQHAIDIRTADSSPESIVAVAQKFWDFLRKADLED